MSKTKVNLCGVTACLSTIAFSGTTTNRNEPVIHLSNLDNYSISYGSNNFLNTDTKATRLNIEKVIPLIERLNSLHGSTSKTDSSLYHSLSKKLFEKLKEAFPSRISGDSSYSEEALYELLTSTLPRELNKINLCFALNTKEGSPTGNSIRSALLSLYRIDSSHQSEVDVNNEMPLRGNTVFVTPLTKRITGNLNREFLIANTSIVSVVDIGNHFTSSKSGDFLVQEPGIDYKTRKSDLVERFGYGTDGLTYQEQAIRHTLFENFTRNNLVQKRFTASDKIKETASELYTQFRLLFKGELPGYTWAKILQRNNSKSLSSQTIASKLLFEAVSESLNEDPNYKPGAVTAKLINAFEDEGASSKLYDSVLGKIFYKFADLKEALKAKVDHRRSQKYDLTGVIPSESDSEFPKSSSILAAVLLGAIGVVGLLRHSFNKIQNIKPIHIDKIPHSSKHETNTSELPPLSPHDEITNSLFNDICDLKKLERLVGMPNVLSQIAEEAIGDENFQISEEVFHAAYLYMNTPDENYKSMAMSFLKIIYDLQRNGMVPANIGGNNLIAFESMNNVTFDDWINIGYPIYRLIRDDNLSFHQITLRQLAHWGDSNGAQTDTLSFLDDALRNDCSEVVSEVLSSWRKMIEHIRLGCLGFRLSEQVSWGAK